jgi:hypothetical protein
MVDFNPYLDRFVSPTVAPGQAKLSAREFRAHRRPGSPLPAYRFPAVVPRSLGVDRYLAADLRALAGGALS